MEALKELSFLIQPNCDKLNLFFGFAGKGHEKKTLNEYLTNNLLNAWEHKFAAESFVVVVCTVKKSYLFSLEIIPKKPPE